MLIASDFRDFYDVARSLGVDKLYVYKRVTEIKKGEFEFDRSTRNSWPYPEEFTHTKRGVKHKYIASKVIVGFCGKLYPAVVFEKFVLVDEKFELKERVTLYSKEKTIAYLEKEKLKFETQSLSYWAVRDFSVKTPEAMENFFEGSSFTKLENEFIKHKCPVFVYGRFEAEKSTHGKVRLVLNPRLTDYKFVQVKDPITAWKELYNYISGVLGSSGPELVKISDKELAKKKGHDGEYSFKKPPGKRGKVRWR